jgi:hypothetical protein
VNEFSRVKEQILSVEAEHLGDAAELGGVGYV